VDDDDDDDELGISSNIVINL